MISGSTETNKRTQTIAPFVILISVPISVFTSVWPFHITRPIVFAIFLPFFLVPFSVLLRWSFEVVPESCFCTSIKLHGPRYSLYNMHYRGVECSECALRVFVFGTSTAILPWSDQRQIIYLDSCFSTP